MKEMDKNLGAKRFEDLLPILLKNEKVKSIELNFDINLDENYNALTSSVDKKMTKDEAIQ